MNYLYNYIMILNHLFMLDILWIWTNKYAASLKSHVYHAESAKWLRLPSGDLL